MKSKGLVAMLDAMLAYAVAFTLIGLVILLMTNTNEADIKSTYTLNVWAEDLADAIGTSMVPDAAQPDIAWKNDIDPQYLDNLGISLRNIVSETGIYLFVQVEGGVTMEYGSIDDVREMATARRFLTDASGELKLLTVKVGI